MSAVAALRQACRPWWPRVAACARGRVEHVRHVPRTVRFAYPVDYLLLDCDRLPSVMQRTPWYAAGRPGLIRFRRRDYLPDRPGPLAEAARDLVGEALGQRPTGRVLLLTALRFGPVAFNPVNFYCCADADGRFVALIAEITNTPWNERHRYVLAMAANGGRSEFDKSFHISPFQPMAQRYRWSVAWVANRLTIDMRSYAAEGGRLVFQAQLACRLQPCGPAGLFRALWRAPAMPLRMLRRIYWQAWRRWREGTPTFEHPRAGGVVA